MIPNDNDIAPLIRLPTKQAMQTNHPHPPSGGSCAFLLIAFLAISFFNCSEAIVIRIRINAYEVKAYDFLSVKSIFSL